MAGKYQLLVLGLVGLLVSQTVGTDVEVGGDCGEEDVCFRPNSECEKHSPCDVGMCVCEEGYDEETEGVDTYCAPEVKIGADCGPKTGSCPEHGFCNTTDTPEVCECDPFFVKSANNLECEPDLEVGETCTEDAHCMGFEEDTEFSPVTCESEECTCRERYTVNDDKTTCIKDDGLKAFGEACDDNSTFCDPDIVGLECVSLLCACGTEEAIETYYDDGEEKTGCLHSLADSEVPEGEKCDEDALLNTELKFCVKPLECGKCPGDLLEVCMDPEPSAEDGAATLTFTLSLMMTLLTCSLF